MGNIYSVIEEDPKVEFISNIGGAAKTLSMTCQLRLSNMKTFGKIFILDDFNSITSEYQLHIKNADILIAIAFRIFYDGYETAYIHRKVENVDLTLTYNAGSEEILLIDQSQNISYKNLATYLMNHYMKEILITIENAILKDIVNRRTVSSDVGHDYSFRSQYRIHEKKLNIAFNNFINKVVNITNQLIKDTSPNIIIPKIFGVLKGINNKQILKKYKCHLMNLNSLTRKNALIILPEKDLVILYSSIDFDNLHIKFNNGEVNKEEFFKTEDSYLKLALKRVDGEKVDISLVQCEFKNFQSSSKESEVNLIIDYQVSFVIQEKLKEYLKLALKDEELNILATNPTNVEIAYDSDEFMEGDSSDKEF